MIVYKVFGSHYDSWYEGNTYSSRDLAEAEAAYLNKRHQEYELHRLVEEQLRIEEFISPEPLPNGKTDWVNYGLAVDALEYKYKFIFKDYGWSCSDIAGLYVRVQEIEVLEALPSKFSPQGVDIHSAVINAFKS